MDEPKPAGRVTTRRFTDEVVCDEMAAILRAKTPAERLAIAFGMWDFAREMIYAIAVKEHPDWASEQLDRYVAGRMSDDNG